MGALNGESLGNSFYSHAAVYKHLNEISEFAIFDTDSKALKKACDLWKVVGFDQFHLAIEKFCPDIVSICTPTESHLEYIEILSNKNIKIIFCEKPLVASLSEYEKLRDISTPISVNYARNFDPEIEILKNEMRESKYGKLLNVNFKYCKGILNSGCHSIALLFELLGLPIDYKILSGKFDYSEKDPTIDCWLSFENCSNVYLMGMDARSHFVFDYEFYFEKAKVSFCDLGYQVSKSTLKPSERFAGYSNLATEKTYSGQLTHSLLHYISSGLEHIKNKQQVKCSLDLAYTVESFIHKLIQEYLGGKND